MTAQIKGDFAFDDRDKKVKFVGNPSHKGITSDHCRALIATYFWQNQQQGPALLGESLSKFDVESLCDPELWVRKRKRTNPEKMRREIPNYYELTAKYGKLEEREFRNKNVKGLLCHIYSAGGEMLKFTAFKDTDA